MNILVLESPLGTPVKKDENRPPLDGDWILVDDGNHKTKRQYHELVEIIEEPEVITAISKRALRQRFTSAERKAFRNSADDNVIDMREDLNYSRYVDLTLPDFEMAVNYLHGIKLISDETKVNLMADGKESEKYRGVL